MPTGLVPVSYLEKQMLNLASVMQANSSMDFAVLFSNVERQFTVTLNEYGMEILFDCFAKDFDEAKGKAAEVYPGFKIVDVVITTLH